MEFSVPATIAILDRTPTVLSSLLGGLDPEWTSWDSEQKWNPFNVVGHLIDGEEKDWISRARIILAGNPAVRFETFDRFRHIDRNRGRMLDDLLEEFASLRADNISQLRAFDLTPEDLTLRAEHPELGTVTLAELLSTWTVHDLGHIAQITRAMAGQYAEYVGPWRAFLRVLTRT